MVGCPYAWLTGRGDDLVLPAWLGRLTPPLRACLRSLLLESGPWPFFILRAPANRERERERDGEQETGMEMGPMSGSRTCLKAFRVADLLVD